MTPRFPAQAVKTLVHELAHALLHGDGVIRTREIEEVEVESVASVIGDAIGLDTSDYSFRYVATWSGGDIEKIKETGDRVVQCPQEILDDVRARGCWLRASWGRVPSD